MKTETILKTDMLDILFNNKNKDYGAYELRKYYPSRLKKSLIITTCLALVFAALQSWKTPKKTIQLVVSDIIELPKLDDPKIEKKKVIEKTKAAAQQKVATVQHTNIVIVKDPPKTTVPTTNAIDTSAISTATNTGTTTTTIIASNPIKPTGGKFGNGDTTITNTTIENEEPIFSPSTMPQFAGGIEALKRFMLQHLQQPNDIEQGEKIVVIAQFVIDKNGNIDDIEIIQSGREDLDKEVIRVISKMPNWKPGLQNGFPVAVYFKMPISFVNND